MPKRRAEWILAIRRLSLAFCCSSRDRHADVTWLQYRAQQLPIPQQLMPTDTTH
jgi:hypothetical protein